MGTDTPLAVLSDEPQLLYNYFKQLFAQVTNPPIDPIRERVVMDLRTYVGGFTNILTESPKYCRRVAIDQPVLASPRRSSVTRAALASSGVPSGVISSYGCSP